MDLLRALALLLVVLGHWLVSAIGGGHGRLTGHSALESLTWAYPITWLFQVIPVFFMVGGYANAASLTSHRNRGGTAAGWLTTRAARLVRSTTALVLVLVAGALLARILGVDPVQIRYAVWAASIPLWFLSAYLVVIALTPVMHALHRRFGPAVPVVLVVLVALGDLARFHHADGLVVGNVAFGWLAMHQVGFFWRDGRPRLTPRRSLLVLLGGLAALVLLTVVGPYPVTMIDVSTERIKNASPPTVALLAAATFQLGLIMVLDPLAQRWLHRQRPWQVVIAANRVLLTIFLWHMSAVVLLAGGLAYAHLLPSPPVGTVVWWLWRIPWLIMLAVVLAVLVAIFSPIESRRLRRPEAPPRWLPLPVERALVRPVPYLLLTVAGLLAAAAGLWLNNVASRFGHDLLGIPTGALALYLAGALVLRLLRAIPEPRR